MNFAAKDAAADLLMLAGFKIVGARGIGIVPEFLVRSTLPYPRWRR